MLNYYKPNPNSNPDEFIDSDYSDLTEEELIEVLDKGGLSEKKFQMLLKAMENKGLKGMIMAVPDPDTNLLATLYERHLEETGFWSCYACHIHPCVCNEGHVAEKNMPRNPETHYFYRNGKKRW